MANCTCGNTLPEWFKQASKCQGCGFSDMGQDQIWLRIKGVCTPYHRGCAPKQEHGA